MTRILGFCGNIGSGKDTCCKFLCGIVGVVNKSIPGFSINDAGELIVNNQVRNENSIAPNAIKNYKFASYLKEFCINVLGLNHKLVYGDQSDKNTLTHIKWEDCPGIITNKLLYNSVQKHIERKSAEHSKFRNENKFAFHEPGFMTVRDVLQFFGTEIVRKMYGPAWVNATINQIQSDSPKFAVISDARFINEFEAIKLVGGKLVKLTRSTENHSHASELDMNVYSEYDAIIDNRTYNVPQLIEKLKETILELDYFR